MLEILNGRDKFYQWDLEQKLVVDDSIIAVHYDNGTGDALVCGVYEYEGQRVADVPNIMLQTYWAIKCYAYCGECVRAERVYEVEKRSRPDDYIYTETETLRYSTLFDMLTDLEAKHNEDVAAIEADIAANSERISTNKINIDVLTKNVDIWRDSEVERHNKQQQQITQNKNDIANLNSEYDARINSLIDETNAGFANVYSEDEKIRQTLRYHETQLTSHLESINENNSRLNNHENRITILENNPTGGGTGGGNASDVDWAENNPDSPAYIKNRTHWEEPGIVETMPETKIFLENMDGMNIGLIEGNIGFEPGKTYDINWNGTTYTTTALDAIEIVGDTGVLIGNIGLLLGGEDTGEPFIIQEMPPENGIGGVMILALDGSTEIIMSAKYEGAVIHKIDDKYINVRIPDWNAFDDEPGYIKNRTHWVEYYPVMYLRLANTEGLDSFTYNGYTAYKVSDRTLPPEAFHYTMLGYRNENEGSYSGEVNRHLTSDWVEWWGNSYGNVYIVYNEKLANLHEGIEAPSKGIYLASGSNNDVFLTVDEIIHQIDNKFLNLDNYYTKNEINNKINPTASQGRTTLDNVATKDLTGFLTNQTNKMWVNLYIPAGAAADDTIVVSIYDINNALITQFEIEDSIAATEDRYTHFRINFNAKNMLTINYSAKGRINEVAGVPMYEIQPSKAYDYISKITVSTKNGTTFPTGSLANRWGVYK